MTQLLPSLIAYKTKLLFVINGERMIKRRCKTQRFILLFICFTSLSSCMRVQQTNNLPMVVPTVDCTSIVSPIPGWEWAGVKIGVSTRVDLIREIGTPEKEIKLSPCSVRYTYPKYHIYLETWNGVLNKVEVYLSPPLKSVSNHGFEGFPKTWKDAITIYGDPDIVSYNSRDMGPNVIWDRKGVLATLVVENQKSLEQSNIAFISYLSADAMRTVHETMQDFKKNYPQEGELPYPTENGSPFDQWNRWLPGEN